MENSDITHRLMEFGLTRQESLLYMTMIIQGEMTGYEAAKLTGISRSNAYNSLAALVEKGAAYIIESIVTKYTAVAVEEFCSNKIRQMNEVKEYLVKEIPSCKPDAESYITIEGDKHIIDKIKNMLKKTESRLYLSISNELLNLFITEIKELIDHKRKVVIITNKKIDLEGAIVYIGEKKENQIRLITDSNYALTGEIGTVKGSSCLYSGKKNFVDLFKEALKNEIQLIEITRGER